MNDPSILKRRLTPKMMETLLYCYKNEALYLDPYHAATLPYLRILILGEMLYAKTYIDNNGKKIIAFYLTNSGRDYTGKILFS